MSQQLMSQQPMFNQSIICSIGSHEWVHLRPPVYLQMKTVIQGGRRQLRVQWSANKNNFIKQSFTYNSNKLYYNYCTIIEVVKIKEQCWHKVSFDRSSHSIPSFQSLWISTLALIVMGVVIPMWSKTLHDCCNTSCLVTRLLMLVILVENRCTWSLWVEHWMPRMLTVVFRSVVASCVPYFLSFCNYDPYRL